MGRIAQRLTSLVAQVLLLFSLEIGFSATSAEAINTAVLLQQYKDAVSKLRESADKQLGPYNISTKCTYCTYSWGKLCWTEETQTFGFTRPIDFSWTRNSLKNVLQQDEQALGSFSASFASTQAWIDQLPDFTSKFNASADRILSIEKDITASGAANEQQRAIVAAALQDLTGLLTDSAVQLNRGTVALTTFLQQQSQYRQSIQQAISQADQQAQQLLNSLRADAMSNAHPDCYNNLVNNNFNPIKSQVSNSLQEISQTFQNLEQNSRAVERSVAEWVVFVVNNQTTIKSVSDLVNAAKGDEIGTFLQRLHLVAAKKSLAELSAK
jgi:hypothetical protein